MKYQPAPTKRFRKDLRRLTKSGVNLQKLEKVIELLANGNILDTQFRDHELKGGMQGYRECHIGPDWLLVYQKDHDRLLLLLLRTGTHRDVLHIE